ncbi:MAG: flippase [Rhodocyclaceae bacterium]|nr:flippase [Rhodocyclaceae bacterium]
MNKLVAHEGFRRYAVNASWLIAEKILRMSVGLIVGIWIARYLGPEQFGLFSYAQSFVFLFTAIATLGLDGIVVRELVKDEGRRDTLLGSAFGLKLVGAILILPMLVLAVQLTSNDNYTNLLVFIIASGTIFQSFNVIDFYYQSKVLCKYVAFANSLSLVLSSVVKILALLNEAPLYSFALITLFDSAVLAAGLIYYYKTASRLKLFTWRFDCQIAKTLLKDSWSLALSSLVVSLYMKIDQVMIKEMMNAEAVGQYAAAVRLSESWYFIPMAISTSVFPAIVNAKQVTEGHYLKRLRSLYTLMIWLGIAIAIPMTFLSKWVVLFLYGSAYHQAGEVLMIHAWSGIFASLLVASGRWYINENLSILAFYRNLGACVLNIVLNVLLIGEYGIKGAAVATLLALILSSYLFDAFNKRTRMQFRIKTQALLLRPNDCE